MTMYNISDETLDIMFITAITMYQETELKYKRKGKVPSVVQVVDETAKKWCDYWEKRLGELK